MKDVAEKHGWDPKADVYEGMGVSESAFVDDCVLWNGHKDNLSRRAGQLLDELALWGLRVNVDKSQVYHSPYSRDQGPVRVGAQVVMPDDRLDVMGIPFKVGLVPRDAMQSVFAKTK